MGETAPVNVNRSAADVAEAASRLERLRRHEGPQAGHEHRKPPNFFQEQAKNIADAPKEKTVGKAIWKATKGASGMLLGAGVVVEGAAAFMLMEGTAGMGIVNFASSWLVGHPVVSGAAIKGTAIIAGKFLAPAGIALASPWIIANLLQYINKAVGGATVSIGGGHSGGGDHGGH